jgi:hypothetical protein
MMLLPRAFVYEYGGAEGGIIKLRFTPNPSFHPASHESEVFHQMQGVLWVDRRQHRLAELDGTGRPGEILEWPALPWAERSASIRRMSAAGTGE